MLVRSEIFQSTKFAVTLMVLQTAMAAEVLEHRPDSPLRHCGVACLYGAFQIVGKPATTEEIENRIRELFPDSDLAALNLQQLRKAAESYGVSCTSLYVPPRDVLEISVPCSATIIPPL